NMEPDHKQWINWAISAGIEPKVIEFISTFPEYLHKINEDDLRATPRSYERISKIYSIYKNSKDTFSPAIFHNVVKGNVGRVIAQEFINFVEKDHKPLISYEDVFKSGFGENFKDGSMDGSLPQALAERIKEESHTRLYLSARNILQTLEMEIGKLAEDASSIKSLISRLVSFLKLYPVDLMIAIMKDIRNNYPAIYKEAIENEAFVDSYFDAYSSIS
ncbi:MAG: MoxR family ATPase, partial [Desulfitobacterium sp.]|nr:MoxR family ATPase [Desulfitobacterium sp.]